MILDVITLILVAESGKSGRKTKALKSEQPLKLRRDGETSATPTLEYDKT